MWSSGASGSEPQSVSPVRCELAIGSASGSDDAMDIRLRLEDRPSPNSGDCDCGTRDESRSMGSGSVFCAVGDPDGNPDSDPSSADMGELSSMISWIERVVGTLDLIANAGVVNGAPAWAADDLGVEAANRGVA